MDLRISVLLASFVARHLLRANVCLIRSLAFRQPRTYECNAERKQGLLTLHARGQASVLPTYATCEHTIVIIGNSHAIRPFNLYPTTKTKRPKALELSNDVESSGSTKTQ